MLIFPCIQLNYPGSRYILILMLERLTQPLRISQPITLSWLNLYYSTLSNIGVRIQKEPTALMKHLGKFSPSLCGPNSVKIITHLKLANCLYCKITQCPLLQAVPF